MGDLHTALRQKADESWLIKGKDVTFKVREVQQRMRSSVEHDLRSKMLAVRCTAKATSAFPRILC